MPGNRRKSSYWKGFLYLAIAAAFYLFCMRGVYSDRVPVVALSLLFAGVGLSMLFIVGHDACHGSLTPSYKLNRWIGRIAFLAPMHNFSGWFKSHNQRHHGWTNYRPIDPGYPPFSLEEYRRMSFPRRMLERIYRSAFGLGLYYGVEVWWKSEVFPSEEHRPIHRRTFYLDQLLVLAFAAAQYAMLYLAAVHFGKPLPGLYATMALVVPVAAFFYMMGFVTYLHHTHPEIPWFDDEKEWNFFQAQVAGTTHVTFVWFVEKFFLNIMEHSAHHADPMIPLYRLQESQAALEERFPEHVRVLSWNPLMFFRTLRRCKLYDYRQHQWLDFRGRPTSPQLVPATLSRESPAQEELSVATTGA